MFFQMKGSIARFNLNSKESIKIVGKYENQYPITAMDCRMICNIASRGNATYKCKIYHKNSERIKPKGIILKLCTYGVSLVAQSVKKLPAVQETGVWSLGQEDPLEKKMATHSSILAWEMPWIEEPGGLQSMG